MPELDIDEVPSLKLSKPFKNSTKQTKKKSNNQKTRKATKPENYFQGNTSENVNAKFSTWPTVAG